VSLRPSRIERARRRAAGAKRLAIAAAAAGFLGALVLVRAAHPGQSASRTHASRATTTQQSEEDDSFGFGSSSVTPSSNTSSPQVQTSVS